MTNHSLPIYQSNRVLRANVRRLRQLDRSFKARVNVGQRELVSDVAHKLYRLRRNLA
jgi:hypothetical protein